MIKWLFGYMKKYRLLLVLTALFAMLSGGLLLAGPVFMGRAIDAISGDKGVDWAALGNNISILALFYVSGALLSWLSPVLAGRIAAHVVTDIRKDAFGRIQRLPLRFFDTKSHGDLIARMTTDCENIYDGLAQSFVQLFSGAVTVAGTMIIMFVISPVIAAAVLCITPLSIRMRR